MNLVTVIIPYFKKKDFIEETLNSVLKQTYKHLEIILIFDDEEKADLDFIKILTKLDDRIILLINETSLGAGLSRNLGIKKASGDYICFIDSDDLWDENKIKIQLEFMVKNNYKITHTSYKIIDKNNKIIGLRKARNFENINDLLKSCDIGLSSVMLKRNILNDDCLFPNLKTKEDFVLWLNILDRNIKIGSLNENLSSWRKLNNSLSSSTFQKILDGYKVYKVYMKFNFLKSIYYLVCLSLNFLKKS